MKFFKDKDENLKLAGKESTVQSEQLLNEKGSDDSDQLITTELSIHPDWNLPKEDYYAYSFLNLECKQLKANQLAISGINLVRLDDATYQVTAFVRNSLDKDIELGETSLILLNEKKETIARATFNLKELGTIPARSSRPWHFYFAAEDFIKQEVPEQGWTLTFNLQSNVHMLDLEPSWKKSLSKADQQKLQDLVKSLTPPGKGEVNFLGLQAKLSPQKDLHIMMLIRNGSDKNIKLEKLPLQVLDAKNELVAKGNFELKNFVVKANTSKPWSFIFPKKTLQKKNPDLSKWKAFSPK